MKIKKHQKNKIKNVLQSERLKRRGYELNDEGTLVKKTILAKYYEKGYLDMIPSMYSAEDRKKVGELLALDYYLGMYEGVKTLKFERICAGFQYLGGQEDVLFHRQRYLAAIQSIPEEFWPAVRQVCIEDKELTGDTFAPSAKLIHKSNIYHKKMLLNLGLERLIGFYLKKNKKSS